MPAAKKTPALDSVNLSEADGLRFMHLGNTEWVQGAMRIARPWKLELQYARDMMCWESHVAERAAPVWHIVQLGLGVASLSKHCFRTYPLARITAVELNPQVVAACRQFFKMPLGDERFQVVVVSADTWVNAPENHGTVDVLQVDLYDAQARGPVFDTVDFYRACRACLTAQGVMTVNVFGGEAMVKAYPGGLKHSLAAIGEAFDGRVSHLPPVKEGNVVVMAWL
jgi:spermidine synthase